MNNYEYRHRLHALKVTANGNLQYHQTMEWRWWIVDKFTRIVVGALAVVGLVLAVPGIDLPMAGLAVAIASAIAGVSLNVVPVGDWEKEHGELFRLWSDLHADAVAEEVKTCDADDEKEAKPHMCDRIIELAGKLERLCAVEPAPWRKLLLRCEGNAYEAAFGKGIRCAKDVEKRRTELQLAPTASADEASESSMARG